MQVNLFEQIDTGFCFDEDINEIVKRLDEIFEDSPAVEKIKKTWSIWDHVPQYGYRLDYYLILKGKLTERQLKDLDKVVLFAKERKIELNASGLHYWMDGTGSMFISTMYKDKRIKMK